MKYNIDKELKLYAKNPPMNRAGLAVAATAVRALPKPFDKKLVQVEKRVIGKAKIHIITPLECVGKVTPCLFYIHGGAFVLPETPFHRYAMQKYALDNGIRVVGVDYALAPSHPFPEALHQCLDVYYHLLANAKELKIDPSNVAVGGDSAGGSLSLDLCLALRDKKPKGLFLIYPVVDHRCETPSMKAFEIGTPNWDGRANKKMWGHYLGQAAHKNPLERIDELDVEHVYIELTEFDCLHDEGMNLYLALKEKGIDAELFDTKGTFHGYDNNNKNARPTIEAFKRRNDFLSRLFK